MKKVLSVALASAMVLGMGVSSFAITYSTGSNDEADWPKNFQFDGELFVTDKDGDIIEEATTELNDSESVDFEPGDVIWMPLYADDQYVWTNTYTKGEDGQDAVSSIRLDESYFIAGVASEPEKTVNQDVTANVNIVVDDADSLAEVTAVSVGGQQASFEVIGSGNGVTGQIRVSLTADQVATIAGSTVDTNTSKAFSKVYNVNCTNGLNTTSDTIVVGTKATYFAATEQTPAQLNEVPTKVNVVDNDGNSVERTVSSAKAVVNGKTYTVNDVTNASKVADFIKNVNDQLNALDAAGKSAQVKDVTVTVNLAEKKATDDVVNKPHIEVADDDKVMVDYGHYTGNIDKNWSINLIEKSTGVAELIEKAELYKATATDYASYSKFTDEIMPNAVYLKITLEDTWKTVDSETLTYYVYVADNDSGKQTNEVWVSGKYVNNNWEYVDFDWTNDASKAQLWKVRKGENGTAVFDFADKAFFTVKMYSGESMYLDLSTAYDKAIAGEMDAEADSFYKFDNDNANFSRTGELIIVTDDSSLVPYEIDEDGNFVEVDAKYVEDYAIAHTNKKVDGFVFSTKTLGNYVLSTEELGQEEKPVDETPVVEEPTTETPADNTTSAKPNPETGAEDFVGLAVSLAVVSVAAAGALALKK